MKKLIALLLVLITVIFSGCNSYPFKYSKKDARAILKSETRNLRNTKIYNFSGNVLLFGDHKAKDQKKFIIYSYRDNKIINEAVFDFKSSDEVYAYENKILIFEKEKEEITYLNENLCKVSSYPFKTDKLKDYKICAENDSVYILDRTAGITKKSIINGEETVLYSGSIEPFDYLESDNYSYENELFEYFGENNCIFFL